VMSYPGRPDNTIFKPTAFGTVLYIPHIGHPSIRTLFRSVSAAIAIIAIEFGEFFIHVPYCNILPHWAATIQYCTVHHVAVITVRCASIAECGTREYYIIVSTVQYVSDGALRLLQDSDQAPPITFQSFPNGACHVLRGKARGIIFPLWYPHRSTRDIPSRNLSGDSEMCVVVILLVRAFFVSHSTCHVFHSRRLAGTGAPCRGTRTSRTERVEQKERITWSK
jgi:hypothetical protein